MIKITKLKTDILENRNIHFSFAWLFRGLKSFQSLGMGTYHLEGGLTGTGGFINLLNVLQKFKILVNKNVD